MSQQPITLILDFGGIVKISPPLWPNHQLNVQPGDLSQFTPNGNGMYGYFQRTGHPFFGADPHEAQGGIVYFSNSPDRSDLEAMLRTIGVSLNDKDYAVFIQTSKKPRKEGYLHQMRIVSRFALKSMFGAITEEECERFECQSLSVGDMLWLFLDSNRRQFGTNFFNSPELDGLFGGDGDFSREELSFGFTVENAYYSVYRIWSRAWLVTK